MTCIYFQTPSSVYTKRKKCETEFSLKTEMQSPFQISPRTITKREPESPLPIPFELPHNYPPLVMAELEKQNLLHQ